MQLKVFPLSEQRNFCVCGHKKKKQSKSEIYDVYFKVELILENAFI